MPRMTALEMMTDPDQWPLWPILPLKRPGQIMTGKGTGFLLALDTHYKKDPTAGPISLFYGNIYDTSDCKRLGDIAAKFPHDEYASIQALVNEGWVVD